MWWIPLLLLWSRENCSHSSDDDGLDLEPHDMELIFGIVAMIIGPAILGATYWFAHSDPFNYPPYSSLPWYSSISWWFPVFFIALTIMGIVAFIHGKIEEKAYWKERDEEFEREWNSKS